MEPPWKSLSVIVVTAFFFDMAAAGAVAVEYRRSQWMGSCDSCCCFGARLIDLLVRGVQRASRGRVCVTVCPVLAAVPRVRFIALRRENII
jgi:hypothetical protein